MSLIQQALEKTNRIQETKTANASPSSKVYERDPMGAALEQELTQVQQAYSSRRFFKKVLLGALLMCLVVAAVYYGVSHRQTNVMLQPAMSIMTAIPQTSLKMVSGPLYRLTGITNSDGKSMAVINGEVVSVGDVLSGRALVKAIGPGEVRLDVQGRDLKLTL